MYVQSNFSPIYNNHGEISGVSCFGRNITDIQNLNQQLEESKGEMTDILESITDAFFALDNAWNFVYINKEAERLLQRSRQELIARNIWECFPDAVHLEFYTAYHKAVRTRERAHFEAYYPPLKTWFKVTAYPRARGLSVYFQDVSNEKRLLETLMQQNIELREIARIQSHELRGPVSGIQAILNILDWENLGSEDNAEVLSYLKEAADKLDTVVHTIVAKANKVSSLEKPVG
jgi:PAS domain S-box-containing protein